MAKEYWESSPFEKDSYFAPGWDKKQEEERLASEGLVSDIPSINFKGKIPKELEINKKILFTFIVGGKHSKIGGEKLNIELVSENLNLSFSTKKWYVERGWSIATYLTASQEGEYIFQFKVNNNNSNSLSLIFIDNKKQSKNEKECVKKSVSPVNLTKIEKAKFISTIIAETGMGSVYLRDIAWVYYNLVNDLGFEKGMKRSSAYKAKNRNYKLCMYYLGEGNEYKDFKYDGTPLNKYINENEWFKKKVKPQIDEMKSFIEDDIFIEKPKTCYKGWHGQGYWRDLDLNPEDGLGDKWYKARQYYWLQLQKRVTNKFIEILKDDKNTSFIFDENSIIAFFIKNPSLLPEANEVKKFYSASNGLNFDL